MKFCINLLSILLLCISFNAKSESLKGSANEVFKAISVKYVDDILATGSTHIGELDLRVLKKELLEVKWHAIDGIFLAGSGGHRGAAVYVTSTKSVYVNILSVNNMVGSQVSFYPWALHEALGALGYKDENYELTSVISFIAETKSVQNKNILQRRENIGAEIFSKNPSKRSSDVIYDTSEGGVTVIGGGGDFFTSYVKLELLKALNELAKELSLEMDGLLYKRAMKNIIQMQIEFEQKSLGVELNQTDYLFDLEKETLYFEKNFEHAPELASRINFIQILFDIGVSLYQNDFKGYDYSKEKYTK